MLRLAFQQAVSIRRTPISHRQLSHRLSTSMSTTEDSNFPVQAAIEQNLRQAFQPLHLQVMNESHRHNVPKGSETHFKVVVVSDAFTAVKSPVARHRMVNAALAEQLKGPVHALSIVCKTPAQWQAMLDEQGGGDVMIAASPACAGGDGSLPKRNEG
ncbi:hypothetical protein MPSEU_000186200 [Mayamaea pseudoterrestris]|nr:hypothetical protein MPSEU_000186200 [Mayamaea pseudoterrestris]